MSTFLVTGSGSVWSNSGGIYIQEGQFNITVSDGGKLFAPSLESWVPDGGTNTGVLVSGANSLLSIFNLNIDVNNASLVVTNGGKVLSGFGFVGSPWEEGSSVTVAGSGSVWSNAYWMAIGKLGFSNQMVIADGGQVFTDTATIGADEGVRNSRVLVVGTGSVWHVQTSLDIGVDDRYNSLSVSNGGIVEVGGNVNIGYGGLGSGANTASVSGVGSVIRVGGTLRVGAGTGGYDRLTISDSGTVVATNVIVGSSSGNLIVLSGGHLLVTNAAGTAVLDIRDGVEWGGMMLNSGTVTVDRLVATRIYGGTVTFNGGTLDTWSTTVSNWMAFTLGDGTNEATFNLRGGNHFFDQSLRIASNSFLTGEGTIASSLTNAGTIMPGNSPGILTVTGDATMLESSLILMELAGTNSDLFDQIVIGGMLTADGELTVSLIDGFWPARGDWFDLFDYSAVTGSFSQINLPNLGGPNYWDTSHLLAPPSDPRSGSILFLPEPATSALLLAGGVVCLGRRRSRPKSSARLACAPSGE